MECIFVIHPLLTFFYGSIGWVTEAEVTSFYTLIHVTGVVCFRFVISWWYGDVYKHPLNSIHYFIAIICIPRQRTPV